MRPSLLGVQSRHLVDWIDPEGKKLIFAVEAHDGVDPSRIVRTMAMQALADLAFRSPRLLPEIMPHIEELVVIGTPAMKARGKKLLAQFEKAGHG